MQNHIKRFAWMHTGAIFEHTFNAEAVDFAKAPEAKFGFRDRRSFACGRKSSSHNTAWSNY
jgi:hypothetical protein